MSEGTQPKSTGLPKLPAWDLMATAAQLYEQQEHTHVILKTYETFLSDLIGEFNDKNTKKKAQKVETAATDLRTAYSQYIAIASSFLTKTKDAEQRKQVKDAMATAAAEHATFQKKANEVTEKMEGEDEQEERGRRRIPLMTRQTKVQALKPVKELEPTITAHFKLSGSELEKWVKQMTIWSQASGFESCKKPVQVAFAEKFVEDEMSEKIKEQADFEEVELDFKSYVEFARALCQTSSQLFARRVEFFLLRCKDQSAKGFIEYMNKIMKEYKAADVGAMAGDPKSYAVYKAVAEMPATLRNRVVKTMENEMSFEELRKELEKVASLKIMEEAVGKQPKVTKITSAAAAGQQGQAGGGGGNRQRRPSFLPEGFNPADFGCLRCGERTDPPHEARHCSLEKKDLECTFCGIKGSHVEAVCFKKLEAEGKLVSKQPPETRSQSPAGGRSRTPGPGVKLNKILEVGKSQETRSRQARGLRCAAVWPKLNKIGGAGKGQKARSKQPRVCTLRTLEDGLPRRQVAVWSAKRGCVKDPAMVVDALCDSGSTAAVASRQKFEEIGGELKVFTHDTIKLASSSGEELEIKGAFDIWVKLSEEDKYKRRIEVLVVDGIDEDLILGVEQLKLLGLLPRQWPMVEVEQGGNHQQAKMYTLRQEEISEEEELQEKIDRIEDSEEDFPEGPEEVQEVPEGAWEICQDEHTVEDVPGIESMPKRVQEILRKHKEVFSNRLRKELNWPEQDIELLPGLPELPRQATRAKRIPARFFDHAWKQLQALKHQGIFKQLDSIPPADAVVCNTFWTQKAGAGPNVGRMVVDSRPLNVLIRRGHHPAYDPATLVKGMEPTLRSYWKCDLSQAFY